MIKDTKDTVHPSFVEIIKQMSPIDARIFQLIMNAGSRPLINLRVKREHGGSYPIQYHCSWIQDFSIKQCATSLDSLLRLGLIEIPFDGYYTDEKIYNHVKQNPLFKKLEQSHKNSLPPGETLDYEKSYIKLPDLSLLFYEVCVLNP